MLTYNGIVVKSLGNLLYLIRFPGFLNETRVCERIDLHAGFCKIKTGREAREEDRYYVAQFFGKEVTQPRKPKQLGMISKPG
jgi:hypothetical protein